MITVSLDLDTPLYTPMDVQLRFDMPIERVRMWEKSGVFVSEAPKVGRGGIKKYTFLDVLRLLLIAYMGHYNMAKATSGEFAEFVANRVRGRQKLGNLFGWEESLWLYDGDPDDEGEFENEADGLTLDKEFGVFRWDHWGIKADSREGLLKHIHREFAQLVRVPPLAIGDGQTLLAEVSDEVLDAPLSNDDYRILANELGPLSHRIAIVPIGFVVNATALHLQPDAFPPEQVKKRGIR